MPDTIETPQNTAEDQVSDPGHLPDEVNHEGSPADQVTPTGSPEPTPDTNSADTDEPETFPRDYVEKLRKEAADHRAKAKDRDTLAERLHLAQVAATGRLADPTDLPYHEDLLDPDKLTEALDALLARKPHLASRRPHGDVGQGATGVSESVNLADMLRARA